jgi:probable LLM family oxidoreductase
VEIGVYTFAEATADRAPAQRLSELLEEAELAEQVGLDVFGIGEHHRADFLVSAPAVALAAVAARTTRIRLTSAVTVLSSDDPIRVFQEFSELDLLSGGRAEIMAGRGSFIESFPLFGYDLDDYERLFDEKLAQLLEIRATGEARGRGVHPRPMQAPLPVWIAVGGTPASAARAGALGLPMAIGIIGGQPERFAPFAEIHRDAAQRAGHEPPRLSINSHAYLAETSERAADDFWPGYAEMMTRIGRERGWPPMQRPTFDALRTLRGALVVGTPEDVTEKILFQHSLFGHDRFLAQISVGGLEHAKVLRSIELLGTEVAPAVRAELSRSAPSGRAAS